MEFVFIGIVISFLIVLAVWVISVQRRLVIMDENIRNTMSRIGVQISSCFDVLAALLDLLKGYSDGEAQTVTKQIRIGRIDLSETSAPQDVSKQEALISGALKQISVLSDRYTALKSSENFTKCINAAGSYQKMLHANNLIYNNSVTKLNRQVRKFPTSLVAGIFGFHERGYLEEPDEIK